jgi:hypothetical protein
MTTRLMVETILPHERKRPQRNRPTGPPRAERLAFVV